jgi:hypothetical protein
MSGGPACDHLLAGSGGRATGTRSSGTASYLWSLGGVRHLREAAHAGASLTSVVGSGSVAVAPNARARRGRGASGRRGFPGPGAHVDRDQRHIAEQRLCRAQRGAAGGGEHHGGQVVGEVGRALSHHVHPSAESRPCSTWMLARTQPS